MEDRKTLIITLVSFAILVLVLILIFLFSSDSKNNDVYVPKKDEFENKNVLVDVYKKVKISDLLEVDSKKIVDDFVVDTSFLGEKEIEFYYLDEKNNKVKSSFTLNVVDKTPPYFGLGIAFIHVIGDNFDMMENLFCGDNYTVAPKCYIVGDYDLTKVGDYPVVVRAEDESGNFREGNIVIKVVEKEEPSNSVPNVVTFEELKERVPSNAALMIDVSKWQADIDWERVKNSGIDYAMLRLGTQMDVGAGSIMDSYFEQNIKNAKDAGVKVGVYYYSYARNVKEAKEQAEWVNETLKPYKLDLPIAFDWECYNLFKSFEINFHTLNEIANTFLSTLKDYGHEVMMYGSKNYLENVWTYLDYDVWLAHYTDKTTYSGKYIMWQFTSSGRVPGIYGNVDVGLYYR